MTPAVWSSLAMRPVPVCDPPGPPGRATEELMARLYPGGHPYGRRTKGSIAIVESLTREQLLQLHASRFAPSELTAVMVGDVETARAVEAATRVLGSWRKAVPVPIV